MADLPYHEAPAHTTNDLPVMLPGKLVGRDQILASIYGELKQNRPVLLHGKPGIGKTAIAATLASAYTQQPGGALWLTTDEDSLAALIVRVGRAYGDMDLANSENPAGMVGAAATLLAQHKPFVVLDGHPLMPAVTEFVNKLAPNLPVMILAEDDIPGIWRGFEVAPLSEQDAVTLYSEKSGQTTPEVRQLVGVLGYQPLSIVVSAGIARIAKMDAPAMLAALRDSGGSALQVGFEKLQPALQGILLMLGATFNGSASLELLSMISGAPAETIQKVMTILAAAGFVQQDQRYGSPYYSLHPLVHDYAQRFLRDSGRLVTLQDKVRDTVLAYARKHTGSDESDYDALAVEMDTFLATAHWASQRGEPDVASQITVAMTQAGNFVRGCGYLYELLQLQESGSSGSSPFPANPDLTAPAQMPPGTTLVDDDDLDDDANFDDTTIDDTTIDQVTSGQGRPGLPIKLAKFSAYFPREATPEQRYSLLIYTYNPHHKLQTEQDVQKFQDELGGTVPKPRLAKKSASVATGTKITVVPGCDEIEFEPESLTKRWMGDWTRYNFEFRPTTALLDETLFIRVSIQISGVEIAHIKCAVDVVEGTMQAQSAAGTDNNPLALANMRSTKATPYQRIFISYSRRDSDVAKSYKLAQRAMGNEAFLDVDNLRAGENWRAALARAIDEADIFQLFWSEHSAGSQYCRHEWDYALKTRCADGDCEGFIRPVYWRKPMPSPPQELRDFNFHYVPFEDKEP
jgi:energy-coupling factor transporter ATP-binding protein EcfA2